MINVILAWQFGSLFELVDGMSNSQRRAPLIVKTRGRIETYNIA